MWRDNYMVIKYIGIPMAIYNKSEYLGTSKSNDGETPKRFDISLTSEKTSGQGRENISVLSRLTNLNESIEELLEMDINASIENLSRSEIRNIRVEVREYNYLLNRLTNKISLLKASLNAMEE
jgi:hypothetical protein